MSTNGPTPVPMATATTDNSSPILSVTFIPNPNYLPVASACPAPSPNTSYECHHTYHPSQSLSPPSSASSASRSSPSASDSHDDSSTERLLLRKRPGRKPGHTEPKNKRTAQMRAAQKAFRERKDNYVKELEERVKRLEKEKGEAFQSEGGGGGSSGSGGGALMRRSDDDEDDVEAENLELGVQAKFLELENATLKQQLLQFIQFQQLPASSTITTLAGASHRLPAPPRADSFAMSLPYTALSVQPTSIPVANTYVDLPSTLVNPSTATTISLEPLYPSLLSDLSVPLTVCNGMHPHYFDVQQPEPSPFSFSPFQPNTVSPDASPLHGFDAADLLSITVQRNAISHGVNELVVAAAAAEQKEEDVCTDPVLTKKAAELIEDESALDELCALFKIRESSEQVKWLHRAVTEACKKGDRVGFIVLVKTARDKRRELLMCLKSNIPSLAPIVSI